MASNQHFIGNGLTTFGAAYIAVISSVVAKFNFSLTANVQGDWVNVTGDPHNGIITASDSRSGGAIGFSSGGTTTSHWNPLGGVNAAYVAATGTGHVVESNAELYRGYFFQNAITYTPGSENIVISGLNPAKTYKIENLMSRQGASQPTRNSMIYCIDNVGTTSIIAITGDYNGDYNAVFTGKVPTSGGVIKMHITQANSGNVNTFGYINLIKITQEN